MLTLGGTVGKINGYTVFGDDASPATFWVLPDKNAPAIARDPRGKASFSLIVYRRDESRLDLTKPDADVGGGILTFTAELPMPDEDLDAIRGILNGRIPPQPDGETPQAVLNIVPFTKGKVRVAIAGETATSGGNEFLRTVVGEGDVASVSSTRKAITAKLSQDGAALLERATDLATLPLFVEYDLTFEHRLEAVKMTVWCNIGSSTTLEKTFASHAEQYQEDGYFDDETLSRDVSHAATVVQTCSRTKELGVTVLPATSEVDADQLAALEKMGWDFLTREVEKCIEAAPLPDDRTFDGLLAGFSNTANNSLNFQLSRSMVLERPFISSAALAGFEPNELAGLVSFVDLRAAFFELIRVPVRVNVDFERMPITNVVVTLRYQRKQFGGSAMETITDSFSFSSAGEVNTFLAYANSLAEVRYDWHAEVFYANSQATATLSRAGVTDRMLIVNVGDLGILAVDVAMGLVDPKDFPQAHVSLRYDTEADRRRVEASFTVSESRPTATWIEVIREVPTAGYEYKVDWRDAEGRILEGKWIRSHARQLVVDGPRRDKLTVTVAATGDFKQLAQVLVALHYEDPAHHYTQDGVLTFAAESQVQVWTVGLQDQDLRSYSYRYTLIYKSGVTRVIPEDGSMIAGQPGFLVVGERYDLEVEILPFLLAFDDRCRLVEVNVTTPHARTEATRSATFTFRAAADAAPVWRVDLEEGADPTYDVTVTYHGTGTRVERALGTQRGSKLILEALPPPPPAPPAPVPVAPTPVAPVG
ncbi:MAG: hypothetical protein Q8P41_22590 [Pseudomonadota bacterium]|nr:hypothetical protein [Pseudomonadota bacterium]